MTETKNEKDILENTDTDSAKDTMVNSKTGIYHDRDFFRKVKSFLSEIEPGTHCILAIDIEHFKIFNKLYGRPEGDRLLLDIATVLRLLCEAYGGIAGYLGGDNFAMFIPYSAERIEEIEYSIIEKTQKWSNTMGFWPAIGVYRIMDKSISVGAMYDKATIALAGAIGNYTQRIWNYSSDMEDSIEEEVQLLAEVQEGLEKDEFIFYIQPQCNINTGKIVGGEALVRWKHGTKGLIPPGIFIPVLERNGFIADLDRYVWRKVCQWIRQCLDKGYRMVPISVNVSRIDIFSMDVAEYLKGLLEEFQIPAKLLKIEITESAYAENNDKIIRTVKQLRDADFIVMMDDFGSGYSSLNMLKSIAVDVIKIDMRFLEIEGGEEKKGIGILESVVNMARQMQMPIIVEGVETQKQENYLWKIGCRYTQGYYYFKPLPVEEIEKLITNERNLDFDGLYYEQFDSFKIREFLDYNLFNDNVINNIIGPAAFYELYENQIEIVRVNEQYYKLAGISASEKTEHGKRFWNHVKDDDRQLLISVLEQAYSKPGKSAEGYIHFLREDGTVLWVLLKVIFLRETDGRKLFYGSLVDMTNFKEKNERNRLSELVGEELSEKQLDRLDKYYGDMPFGYAVAKIILDENEKPYDYEIVYGNKEMNRVCGGDMERLRYMALRAFHNSKEELLTLGYEAAYQDERIDHNVHSILSGRYLLFNLYQYEYGYVGCIMNDVTNKRIYEKTLDNIVHDYRAVFFIHLRDNDVRMVYPDDNHMLERGNYDDFLNRRISNGQIIEDDFGTMYKIFSIENLRAVLAGQNEVSYRYQYKTDDGEIEWQVATIRVSEWGPNHQPKTAIMAIKEEA